MKEFGNDKELRYPLTLHPLPRRGEGIERKGRTGGGSPGHAGVIPVQPFDRLRANGAGFVAGLSRRGTEGSYMSADSAPQCERVGDSCGYWKAWECRGVGRDRKITQCV